MAVSRPLARALAACVAVLLVCATQVAAQCNANACTSEAFFASVDPTRASQVIDLGSFNGHRTVTFDASTVSGQYITFSTCPADGGAFSSNPSICVKDAAGTTVTSSDDVGGACGNGASVSFVVPPNALGEYEVTVAQSCMGTVSLAMDVLGSPCTTDTPFTVARVGSTSGSFDSTIAGIPNAVMEDVPCATFNGLSPSELADRYQILLIVSSTSTACQVNWNTRLQPFLAAGGYGVYFESENLLSSLSPVASFTPTGFVVLPLYCRTSIQEPLTDSLALSLGLPLDDFHSAVMTPYGSSWLHSFVGRCLGVDSGYYGVVPTGGRVVIMGNPLDTSSSGSALRRDIINWLYDDCTILEDLSSTGLENTPFHFQLSTSPYPPCTDMYVDWGDASLSLTNLASSQLNRNDALQVMEEYHTFAQDGTYTVTVYGCGVHTFDVVIENVLPNILQLDVALTVFENTLVLSDILFTDIGYLDPHTSTIDWGDDTGTLIGVGVDLGATGTFAATHIYDEAGEYTITWCVEDDTGQVCRSVDITVVGVPPDIDIGDDTLSSTVGSTVRLSDADVTFSDSGSGTHTATIDWDDGNGPQPATVTESGGSGTIDAENIYLDDGVYTATVCVLDKAQRDAGDPGSCDTITITVANTPPVLSANDIVVASGSPVNLDAFFTDRGQQTHTATVDWGDGPVEAATVTPTFDSATSSTSGPITGTHSYAGDGTYTIRICVTDGTAQDCEDVTAYVGTLGLSVDDPVVSPTTPVENQNTVVTVDFQDTANNGPYTATIDYGDENGPQPVTVNFDGPTLQGSITDTNVFTDPGDYPVKVCVTASAIPATICNTVIVTVDPVSPVFSIPSPISGLEGELIPLSFSFSDGGSGPYAARINWGDGSPTDQVIVASPGTITFPDHVFADDGDFNGQVCVTSLSSGVQTCRSTVFDIGNQPATVSSTSGTTSDTGREGVPFTPSGDFSFNDPGTLDTHTAYVEWGDGTTTPAIVTETPTGPPGNTAGTTGQVELPSHYYADDGTYNVRVCVDDGTTVECRSSTVTVADAPSVITSGPLSPPSAPEGTVVRFGPIQFTDPGTLDSHTICVNWGDGWIDCNTNSTDLTLSENVRGPPGDSLGNQGTATASHVYADDGPYVVQLCIIDQDNVKTCQSTTVSVSNQPPTFSDFEIPGGKNVDIPPIAFNDPGTLDTHTVTINYGDGTGTIPAIINQTPFGPPGSVAGNPAQADFPPHTFAGDGIFFPIVTFRDDDGGVTTVQLTANTAGSSNPNGDGSDGSGANQSGIFMYKEFRLSWLPPDPSSVPPDSTAIFSVRNIDTGNTYFQLSTRADRLGAIWKPHNIPAFHVYELYLRTVPDDVDLWRGQRFFARVVTSDSRH